jgi:hypothetical protein
MFGDIYPLYIFSRDSKTHFVVCSQLFYICANWILHIVFCGFFYFFWILGLHSHRFVSEVIFEMGSILERVLDEI